MWPCCVVHQATRRRARGAPSVLAAYTNSEFLLPAGARASSQAKVGRGLRGRVADCAAAGRTRTPGPMERVGGEQLCA